MKKLISIAIFSITLLLIIYSFSLAGPVPDTGQTKCYGYDNLGEIPCPQPGERFHGQDAQYNINPQSYTKLDANGNDLPDSATEWVMVRDNVTGLIWEIKQAKDGNADYSDPHDADNKYTWYNSDPETNGGNAGTAGDGTDTEDFINALNSERFGGYSDWRMPTVKELSSIVNSGTYYPAINTAYFPNTMSSYSWSATTSVYGTATAWTLFFGDGHIYYPIKSNSLYVRAVHGGK
jgi:hypothetical protein